MSWGMTDVAMLLSAMLGGIESLLKFICHVQSQCRGEDYTAGFINHYHSGKLWEAGKIWVLRRLKFLKLGECDRELVMCWSHIHILQ